MELNGEQKSCYSQSFLRKLLESEVQRARKAVCVGGGRADDVKDKQEKERFLNVAQESGTSTQREGNPRITAGHTADLERNQFRMG